MQTRIALPRLQYPAPRYSTKQLLAWYETIKLLEYMQGTDLKSLSLRRTVSDTLRTRINPKTGYVFNMADLANIRRKIFEDVNS